MRGAGVYARHMGVSRAFLSHRVGAPRARPREPLTSEPAPLALQGAMLVMPLLTMPRQPSEVDEDELDELPPIDGDGGDDPETGLDLDGVGGPEPGDAS